VIGLVWAQSAGGVIGRDNTLPWRLPEDLAHFRRLTTGATVVMGRRTWESLPPGVRPLPGRFNIVMSRDPGWGAEGATRADDFADALTAAATSTIDADVWVIGGASVYEAALPFADRLVVTEIAETFVGDTYAPAIGAGWREPGEEPQWATSETGLHYRIRTYTR